MSTNTLIPQEPIVCYPGAGGLKEVADQAAERQLQKKRKAPEMPTSPFANHKAAHPASADRHPPGSKSMAAAGAGLGSHDAATRVKQKTGNTSSYCKEDDQLNLMQLIKQGGGCCTFDKWKTPPSRAHLLHRSRPVQE